MKKIYYRVKDWLYTFIFKRMYTIYIYNICNKYKDKKIIILGCIGVGDVCISMAYLKPFLENNKSKYVIILSENLDWLYKLYDIDNKANNIELKYLKKKKMLHLRSAFVMPQYNRIIEKLKKKNLIISDPMAYITEELSNYNGLSALNLCRDVIYKLNINTKIEYPIINKNDSKVEIKKHSVFINPYSNSGNIKHDEWQKIIDFYKENNYNVYVNAIKDEKFKNSITLNLSLIEMYSLINQFDMVVSIRSGFLDFMIKNCHHIICLYENKGFINIYALEDWNIKNIKIQNYIVTDNMYFDKLKEGVKQWM